MRYDLPNFRVDFKDWMKGNNLYNNYPTGGLKADSVGYNPFKYPGLVVSKPDLSETTISSSLKRYPSIAWAISRGNIANTDYCAVALSVDDPAVAGDGYFYEVNKTTGGMALIHSATAKDYLLGTTFALPYNSGAIFTSTTGITYVIPSNASAFQVDETLWTGAGNLNQPALSSDAPHPMCYVDDLIYIGDFSDLHEFDTGSFTATTAVFSLADPYIITEVMEYRGYIYIAATQFFYDLTSLTTVKGETNIFLWDGFSDGYLDKFLMPDRITAFKVGDDGRLYVWTAKQFGYMNGIDFVPLRDLENTVYRHHIVDVKNGIMYADGMKMIRYSSVYPGATRRFFFEEQHTKTITSIIVARRDYLTVTLDSGINATAGRNILYADIDNRSGGSRSFEFNTREIKVPVKVVNVVITTDGLGSPGTVQVQYRDENGTLHNCKTFDSSVTAHAAKKRWTFDVKGHPAVTMITPYITITGNAKLKSVDYFYQIGTDTNNP